MYSKNISSFIEYSFKVGTKIREFQSIFIRVFNSFRKDPYA